MSAEQPVIPNPEIRESLNKRELAFAFIKPDNIEDLSAIEKILAEQGLEVMYKDKTRLSKFAVEHIYQSIKDEQYFEKMQEYLTNHDVVVLVVGGPGLSATEALLSLKKQNGQPGKIRSTLQRREQVGAEDYQLWKEGQHPRQDELSVVITAKNVIHTADTPDEAIGSMRLIFGKKFEGMKRRGNLPAEL